MIRDEAIKELQLAGFHAFARDWSLGESIGIAWGEQIHGSIHGWENLLYIYQGETSWQVLDCANHREDSFDTLRSAVNGVLARRKD